MPDSTPPPIAGRVPVAQVPEPTRTLRGPFAGAAQHQFERRDFTGHFLLHVQAPGVLEPPPPEPPPPAPPGEAQLRQELQVAIEAAANADAGAQQAEEAHTRAVQHQDTCAQRLAACSDLDAEIAHAVAGALRSGTNAEEAREVFAERVIERAEAQAGLVAAETAVSTLRDERAAAARAAGDAAKAVETLTLRILAFAAEKLAQEAQSLQAQAAQRRRALLGYDRLLANRTLSLPATVRTVLGEVTAQDVLGGDFAPWKHAMDALRADPQAVVEIELPALVVPPLPVPFHAPGPPVRMTPIQQPAVRQLPSAPDGGDPALPDQPQ
jgi:hypothetical protein